MTAESFRPDFPKKEKVEGYFGQRVSVTEGTKKQSRSKPVSGLVCPSGPVPSGVQAIPDGHVFDVGLTRRATPSQEKMLSKRQRAKNKGK